jgi:hypothetical protein
MDFVEIGRQAFRNGEPAAPAISADVQAALAGLKVGSAKGRKIMQDFTKGWEQANFLSSPELISAEIRRVQHLIEVYLPAQIHDARYVRPHARRRASLERQLVEAKQELSRLVTDLGAAVQEQHR